MNRFLQSLLTDCQQEQEQQEQWRPLETEPVDCNNNVACLSSSTLLCNTTTVELVLDPAPGHAHAHAHANSSRRRPRYSSNKQKSNNKKDFHLDEDADAFPRQPQRSSSVESINSSGNSTSSELQAASAISRWEERNAPEEDVMRTMKDIRSRRSITLEDVVAAAAVVVVVDTASIATASTATYNTIHNTTSNHNNKIMAAAAAEAMQELLDIGDLDSSTPTILEDEDEDNCHDDDHRLSAISCSSFSSNRLPSRPLDTTSTLHATMKDIRSRKSIILDDDDNNNNNNNNNNNSMLSTAMAAAMARAIMADVDMDDSTTNDDDEVSSLPPMAMIRPPKLTRQVTPNIPRDTSSSDSTSDIFAKMNSIRSRRSIQLDDDASMIDMNDSSTTATTSDDESFMMAPPKLVRQVTPHENDTTHLMATMKDIRSRKSILAVQEMDASMIAASMWVNQGMNTSVDTTTTHPMAKMKDIRSRKSIHAVQEMDEYHMNEFESANNMTMYFDDQKEAHRQQRTPVCRWKLFQDESANNSSTSSTGSCSTKCCESDEEPSSPNNNNNNKRMSPPVCPQKRISNDSFVVQSNLQQAMYELEGKV